MMSGTDDLHSIGQLVAFHPRRQHRMLGMLLHVQGVQLEREFVQRPALMLAGPMCRRLQIQNRRTFAAQSSSLVVGGQKPIRPVARDRLAAVPVPSSRRSREILVFRSEPVTHPRTRPPGHPQAGFPCSFAGVPRDDSAIRPGTLDKRTVSSATSGSAMCLNWSHMSIPDSPTLRVPKGAAHIKPLPGRQPFGTRFDSVTWSLFNSGFGSNVSTWLGPPSMNSMMTAFALARVHRRLGRERTFRGGSHTFIGEQVGQRDRTQAKNQDRTETRGVNGYS